MGNPNKIKCYMIVEIATDIMSHSADSEERPFTSYAFEVARICVTFIEEA